MITIILEQQDIDGVRETIRQAMSDKIASSVERGRGQALGGDVAMLLVDHVLLPFLGSLTGRFAYDIAKKKLEQGGERDDAGVEVERFVGAEADTDQPLTATSFDEVRAELLPLGFTEDEIRWLYGRVQRRLRDHRTK